LLKLNLGCGNKKIYGFINIDISPHVNPDILDNIIYLNKFKTQSSDLIFASHVIEHFNYNETKQALYRWYEILKDGGILRLALPDLEKVCAHFLLHHNLKEIRTFLWGGQHNAYDYHKNGWDFQSLKLLLETIGFRNIHRYNWKETEHSYIDDYSQAYLPHMDKVNGILMSLNVEAVK